MTKLRRAIDHFRAHDRDASVLLVNTFLVIATSDLETMRQKDLAVELGIAEGTAAYNVALLTSEGEITTHGGKKRLGLVAVEQVGRERRMHLTAAGKNLARKMGFAARSKE